MTPIVQIHTNIVYQIERNPKSCFGGKKIRIGAHFTPMGLRNVVSYKKTHSIIKKFAYTINGRDESVNSFQEGSLVKQSLRNLSVPTQITIEGLFLYL